MGEDAVLQALDPAEPHSALVLWEGLSSLLEDPGSINSTQSIRVAAGDASPPHLGGRNSSPPDPRSASQASSSNLEEKNAGDSVFEYIGSRARIRHLTVVVAISLQHVPLKIISQVQVVRRRRGGQCNV